MSYIKLMGSFSRMKHGTGLSQLIGNPVLFIPTLAKPSRLDSEGGKGGFYYNVIP